MATIHPSRSTTFRMLLGFASVPPGTLERGRDLYEIGPNVLRVLIGAATRLAGASIFWFVGVRDTELDPDHVDLPGGAGRSLIPRG